MIFLRFFFILTFTALQCETIATFYGPLEIEEPILIELIHSPAVQRLKHIHQYGVSYYTKTHPEEYSRFDHSLGVFAILRKNGASLKEGIAGLLHDVSHTVFSHVGDWAFAKEYQEDDYQNQIHDRYLAVCGIDEILVRYGLEAQEVSPKNEEFSLLEGPLPDLCADRLDYNIQGAYYQNFLTKEEALTLYDKIVYENGKWVLPNQELAMKLAQFSLYMTENCWGSADNSITSRWLADALVHAGKIGLLSWDDVHFGTDQDIWERLLDSKDPFIQAQMEKLADPSNHYQLVSRQNANLFIPFKCRGIDPWVRENGEIKRLSSIDPEFAKAFQKTKQQSLVGWPVLLLNVK